MLKFITVLNYLMVVLFLFAAGVQYNDPDWFLWIPLYGGAALAGAMWRATHRMKKMAPLIILVISLAWIIYMLPGVLEQGIFSSEVASQFKMVNMEVEKTRELGGLVIVGIWMATLVFTARQTRTLYDFD